MGASVGMMRMWGNNKTAKFLMPLLSKEKKKMAMEKVEVKAKNNGFEIPAILTDLDEKSGMPKLFHIEEQAEGEEPPKVGLSGDIYYCFNSSMFGKLIEIIIAVIEGKSKIRYKFVTFFKEN